MRSERGAMPQLLVRNVDRDLVVRLKQRAARAGRTAEAEHRLILEEAPRPGKPTFVERARRHREALRGRVHSDSAELIGEDRDRDYDNACS
jgi:plasmid stability protein